jgi:hypothetical protein
MSINFSDREYAEIRQQAMAPIIPVEGAWEYTADDEGYITGCAHQCGNGTSAPMVACRRDDVGNWYCPRCNRIYGARLSRLMVKP